MNFQPLEEMGIPGFFDSFLYQMFGGSFIALLVENVRNLKYVVSMVLNRGKEGIISD